MRENRRLALPHCIALVKVWFFHPVLLTFNTQNLLLTSWLVDITHESISLLQSERSPSSTWCTNTCRNGGLENKRSSSSSGMKTRQLRAVTKVRLGRGSPLLAVWSLPEGVWRVESSIVREFLTPVLAGCPAMAPASVSVALSHCGIIGFVHTAVPNWIFSTSRLYLVRFFLDCLNSQIPTRSVFYKTDWNFKCNSDRIWSISVWAGLFRNVSATFIASSTTWLHQASLVCLLVQTPRSTVVTAAMAARTPAQLSSRLGCCRFLAVSRLSAPQLHMIWDRNKHSSQLSVLGLDWILIRFTKKIRFGVESDQGFSFWI